MVNKNRIVPIQKIDYLSMVALFFSTMASMNHAAFKLLAKENGVFVVPDTVTGILLANEPVQRFSVKKGADWTITFVASPNFEGFFDRNGNKIECVPDPNHADEPLEWDGVTLYTANYDSQVEELYVARISPNTYDIINKATADDEGSKEK